ncbi:hypothetical protein V6N13_148769 [Hibiscus sabdariffa]
MGAGLENEKGGKWWLRWWWRKVDDDGVSGEMVLLRLWVDEGRRNGLDSGVGEKGEGQFRVMKEQVGLVQ